MLASILELASLTVLLLASVSATPLGLNGGSDILLPRKAATTASMNMPSVCTSALICKQLSVENVKKLPGWATFEKDADANTGTKHLTIRTNDGAEPNSPAFYYVPNKTIKMQKAGNPECVTSTQTTSGEMSGTSGSVTLTIASGYSYAVTATVMETSTVGLTDTMTLSLGFEGVVDGGNIASATVSLADAMTKSDTKTINQLTTSAVRENSPEGDKCTVEQSVETCTYATTGKVQFISGGDVWFDYTGPVKNKADPKGGKHRKWAYPLSKLSEAERSTYMTISGSLSVKSQGKYSVKCTKA
ncbi:hypothetical protein BT96DRAFT_927439 [Gymnopus androsaceus JB14]|uniref:Uncharacterized protein n=1 Tax=Gymnopus androsaceus JB14 TaxID=1447944 RepID=A0A6A4GPP5_9AGAR|nr:hypothetical protein BT96DRAFT_927439 [Gymnopus androsaceus JB14]